MTLGSCSCCYAIRSTPVDLGQSLAESKVTQRVRPGIRNHISWSKQYTLLPKMKLSYEVRSQCQASSEMNYGFHHTLISFIVTVKFDWSMHWSGNYNMCEKNIPLWLWFGNCQQKQKICFWLLRSGMVCVVIDLVVACCCGVATTTRPQTASLNISWPPIRFVLMRQLIPDLWKYGCCGQHRTPSSTNNHQQQMQEHRITIAANTLKSIYSIRIIFIILLFCTAVSVVDGARLLNCVSNYFKL